jgi:hypothetical protein
MAESGGADLDRLEARARAYRERGATRGTFAVQAVLDLLATVREDQDLLEEAHHSLAAQQELTALAETERDHAWAALARVTRFVEEQEQTLGASGEAVLRHLRELLHPSP